jgi:hypothetical protein
LDIIPLELGLAIPPQAPTSSSRQAQAGPLGSAGCNGGDM